MKPEAEVPDVAAALAGAGHIVAEAVAETAAVRAFARERMHREGRLVTEATAEGKAQAWVLGAMPPFLVALLNWMDPEWLRPLSTTYIGYVIVTIAVSFWVAAIFAARKILAVDI